ncbi:MAG: family 43 glycosylhydrolase, partial [Proteiniphilum sp.]|nr:family 43 glycosylhydrolase [Proteiniphilum sp.]
MKKNYLTTLFLLFCGFGIAQNPICPPGLNIADPTTRVWKDGKLYLYGSRDESLNYYGSYDHWVLSTSDLLNWEFTPNAFASKGPFDQVPFNDDMLYAPDCMYKNGMYYLYFCQPGGLEGVATSTSPTGPFTNPKELYLKKKNQIDPAVFIDDDGQAYYTWGQFQAKIAKLKPNMTEIDTTSIVENVITEKEHFFHEGNYMVKRNGIYYMVYADMSRKGMPTCIGYATSKSPMGPYKYGGVIIDNDGCDPNNWNNHGSIVEFKGQWYVFYHRTTHGVVNARKACIEPIYFNEDGSINEVEMTSQGAGKPLDAFSTIEAERACLLHGQVRIESYIWDQTNPLNPDNNNQLGQIKNNDRAVYK